MRTVILFFTVLLTWSYAQDTLSFHRGWQLAGITAAIDDMRVFDKHARIIWAYDAQTHDWNAYSPDTNVSDKLVQNGIDTLKKLDAFDAFWIKSDHNWTLTLTDGDTPNETDEAGILHLAAGWNLVSLPQIAIADSTLFSGMKVWKYDTQWKSDAPVPFPPVETLRTGEGFWIYSPKAETVDIPRELSKLHAFDDEASMRDFIRKMVLENRGRHPIYPLRDDLLMQEIAAGEGEQNTDATTTNVQETGIDESDVLKHDGNHIFFYDRNAQRIHIYTFADIVTGDKKPISDISVDGEMQAMYLDGNRLAVVTQRQRYYILDTVQTRIADTIMPPQAYEPPQFTLTLYNIADIRRPTKISRTVIDGRLLESRLKAGRLYLVSNFDPYIDVTYPVIYPDTNCTRPGPIVMVSESKPVTIDDKCYRYFYNKDGRAFLYDYDRPIIEKEYLVPTFTIDTAKPRPYLQPQRFWAPYKLDQESTVTAVGVFSMQDGRKENSSGYIGNAWNLYASHNALYLSATSYPRYYDAMHYREQTALYKFMLDENLTYRARGFIDGTVLGQYSFSEYDGYLRVASTRGFSWKQAIDNALFILVEKAGLFEEVGSLHGLGEDGERIRAVRFAGDKAFVVTFRQTDPFYTLDLRKPESPRKVGELKINGFSSYLHPVDDNSLLAIGRDADASGRLGGFQIQLFDIRDLSHPRLADKIVFGDTMTHSEVETNPRALAYRANDRRFGLPLYRYDIQAYEVAFDLYHIDAMSLVHDTRLTAKATKGWYAHEGRGIIFDIGTQTYAALFKGDQVVVSSLEGVRP